MRGRRGRAGRRGRPPALNAAQRRTSSASGSSQTGSPASRPVLTTSAMPVPQLRVGQRLERARVDHDPRRPVEGADEVLAAGKVDRGLAADRGVDLADERRRHRHPRDAAHVRGGHEAREVGRAAAAEGDDRAVAADAQRAPEPLEHGQGLRVLARRHVVGGDVALSERELRRDAVDAGDVRVGDDLDGAGAGHELLEQLERADPHVDPGGREHDAVGIVRVGVRGLLVDRQSREVERAERLLVARQRPPAFARPPPRELRVDLEQHRERAARQGRPASRQTGRRRRRARSRRARRQRGRLRRPPPRLPGTRPHRRARTAPRSWRPSAARSRGRGRRRGGTSRRATSSPSVVFPAPMKPTSARCRLSACAATGCARGRRGARRRSRRSRRRRTSPWRCRRAPRPRRPRRRRRAPRPPGRRCARRAPAPASPVSRSTESSGFISVGSGFIAARTTIGSPFEMPASRPPARFVAPDEAAGRSRRAPRSRGRRRARSRRRSRRP